LHHIADRLLRSAKPSLSHRNSPDQLQPAAALFLPSVSALMPIGFMTFLLFQNQVLTILATGVKFINT
jgi:hypothetical protein